MRYEMQCPVCGHPYIILEETTGELVCPHCGAVVGSVPAEYIPGLGEQVVSVQNVKAEKWGFQTLKRHRERYGRPNVRKYIEDRLKVYLTEVLEIAKLAGIDINNIDIDLVLCVAREYLYKYYNRQYPSPSRFVVFKETNLKSSLLAAIMNLYPAEGMLYKLLKLYKEMHRKDARYRFLANAVKKHYYKMKAQLQELVEECIEEV